LHCAQIALIAPLRTARACDTLYQVSRSTNFADTEKSSVLNKKTSASVPL